MLTTLFALITIVAVIFFILAFPVSLQPKKVGVRKGYRFTSYKK